MISFIFSWLILPFVNQQLILFFINIYKKIVSLKISSKSFEKKKSPFGVFSFQEGIKKIFQKGKKGTSKNFCKILNLSKIEKILIFRKISIYCTLFILFYPFDKKWVSTHIFYFYPCFRSRNTHLKPKKYHFWNFEKMTQNSQKWSYFGTKIFNYAYLFFGFTNLDDIYRQEGPGTFLLPLPKFFLKGKKGYQQKFLRNLPKIEKIFIFCEISLYVPFLHFWLKMGYNTYVLFPPHF